MTDSTQTLERLATSDYKYGFVTDIEQETVPPGLNEDVIRLISAKKAGTGVAAGVAATGLSSLADPETARMGAG
jgi:hypothetical protein